MNCPTSPDPCSDKGAERSTARTAVAAVLALTAGVNAAWWAYETLGSIVLVTLYPGRYVVGNAGYAVGRWALEFLVVELILAPAWAVPLVALLGRRRGNPLFLLPAAGLSVWSVLALIDQPKAGGQWALINPADGYAFALVFGTAVGALLMAVGLLIEYAFRRLRGVWRALRGR
jgi:hypothetical protein